jgi:hypothetical protein
MAEPVTPEPTRGPGRRLKETLDTLLVVDVFVVIAGVNNGCQRA